MRSSDTSSERCRPKKFSSCFQQAAKSLVLLGFEEEAENLSRTSFSRHKSALTFSGLVSHCSAPVYDGIARRVDVSVGVVDKLLSDARKSTQKTPRGPVHLARNFYIYDKASFLKLLFIRIRGTSTTYVHDTITALDANIMYKFNTKIISLIHFKVCSQKKSLLALGFEPTTFKLVSCHYLLRHLDLQIIT